MNEWKKKERNGEKKVKKCKTKIMQIKILKKSEFT